MSANGVGSARERVKPLALTAGPGMLTLMEDAVSVDPLAIMGPGDGSYDGKDGDTSSDRKTLGSRYVCQESFIMSLHLMLQDLFKGHGVNFCALSLVLHRLFGEPIVL